jgi:hypothetical protein
MEKTAREWLMELKPEHRYLAIENVLREDKEDGTDFINVKKNSLIDSVSESFVWCFSTQGFVFWYNIHSQLIKNTYYDEEAKS